MTVSRLLRATLFGGFVLTGCGTSTTIVFATGDAAVAGDASLSDGSPEDAAPRSDGGTTVGDSAPPRRAACAKDVAFGPAAPLPGIPKGSQDLRLSGDGLVVAYRTAAGFVTATRTSEASPFPAGTPLDDGPATGAIAWNSNGMYAVAVTADGRGLALRARAAASGPLGSPSEAPFADFNAYQRGIPAERTLESPAMALATTGFSVTEGSRFGRSLLVFTVAPGGGYSPADPNRDPATFGALRITDWTEDGTVAAVDPGADDPDSARFLAIGVDGLQTRVPLPAALHDVSLADDCRAIYGLIGEAENAEAVRLLRQ